MERRAAGTEGNARAKRELLRAQRKSIVATHPVTGLSHLRIGADIAYSTRALRRA
jgi:hypothetical protein